MSRSSVLLALAASFCLGAVGCGGSSDSDKSSGRPTESQAPHPASSDEQDVRATLASDFEANSTGDYEQVCSLFTPALKKRAARKHDPGGSSDCEQAFEAEAESLGDSLADANAIYADAKVNSVAVNNGAATPIVLYGGGSEPATAKLRKVGERWLLESEP